jgi:hypothetical protein
MCGPTGRGTRDGNEPCRDQTQNVEGREDGGGIVNVRETDLEDKTGLAVCAARQGRVDRLLQRLSEPLEAWDLRTAILPVVDEVLDPRSKPQGDVPYSGREGTEEARGAKRAKGYPIRTSERIGNFVAAFLSLGLLSASLAVGLAGMHSRRGARKLVGETGCYWRLGATVFGPAQYRVSSLYCEGNISRRDGRRLWGRGERVGRARGG